MTMRAFYRPNHGRVSPLENREDELICGSEGRLLEETRIFLDNPLDVPEDTYSLTPYDVNVSVDHRYTGL